MPFGHRQREQEEIYFVLAGSGRMKIDDDIVDLDASDAVRVSPASVRAAEAGTDGLELLVFGAPRELGTRPGSDEEPLPGWWAD